MSKEYPLLKIHLLRLAYWVAVFFLVTIPASAEQYQSLLKPESRDALWRTLDHERYMKAYYEAFLKKHGEFYPITGFSDAERRHENALVHVLKSQKQRVPENRWTVGGMSVPSDRSAACQNAINALEPKVEDLARFQALAEDEEIREVFKYILEAWRGNQMKGLKRCAEFAK